MTCGNCVAKTKNQLLTLEGVTKAEVQLTTPQATITMQKHIPLTALQNALSKVSNYTIAEADGGMHYTMSNEETTSWIKTYKPILLVFGYILGVTLIAEAVTGSFLWMRWMSHFMAGFFLVFSFFKLLDIKGFAEGYSSYDVIAKKWMGWGYALCTY